MHVGPLDREDLRPRVQTVLDDHVGHRRALLQQVDPDTAALADAVGELVAGGKRLRAAFAYWGWRAAGARTATSRSGWGRRWSSSRRRR